MEEKRLGYPHKRRLMVIKWFIMLLIGITTGLIAVFVDFSVKNLTKIKFSYVQNRLDSCLAEHCLFQPYLAWIGINIAMVLVSGFLILWEVTVRHVPRVRWGWSVGYLLACSTWFGYSSSQMLPQWCGRATRLAFQGIDCQSVGCDLLCQWWTRRGKRRTDVSWSAEEEHLMHVDLDFVSLGFTPVPLWLVVFPKEKAALWNSIYTSVSLIKVEQRTTKVNVRLDFQIFPHWQTQTRLRIGWCSGGCGCR